MISILKSLFSSSSSRVLDSDIALLWNYALKEGIPMALWRLPQQNTQYILLDFNRAQKPHKVHLLKTKPGFMISPFWNPNLEHSYFLQADVLLKGPLDSEELREHPKLKGIWKEIDARPEYYREEPFSSLPNDARENRISEPEKHYRTLVEKGIQTIVDGHFQKVVLSHPSYLSRPKSFQSLRHFNKLSEAYTNAFTYLFHIPNVATWAGASPETLLSLEEGRIFKTVALAGTQAFQEGLALKEVSWRQKEIEEQALVSRYIINCFKKIRLREFKEEGPKTAVAGNLMHLKTSFEVDMQEANFLELGDVMVDLLHPTSAVCGMPKTPSLDFVRRYEDYDRSFYSGFLGPINIEAYSHLFVNLRCMQIQAEDIILYAGAGVTADSEPKQEWQETLLKARTMSDIIRKA